MSDLAEALVKAQGAAKSLTKGGVNSYHKYKYASAEQRIMSARWLSHFGLSLSPKDFSVRFEGNQWVARREAELLHVSGEARTVAIEWFIVPEKGRPFDKACAASHTASLGYLLRDLLLLPTVNKGEELDDPLRDELNPEYLGKTTALPEEKLTVFDEAVVVAGYDLDQLAELFEAESWPHWNTYSPEKIKTFPQFLDSDLLKDNLKSFREMLVGAERV